MKYVSLYFLTALLLVGCQNQVPSSVEQTAIMDTQVAMVINQSLASTLAAQTETANEIRTQTYTPTPQPATVTPTASNTSTPTNTPKPFDISVCKNFSINLSGGLSDETILPQLANYSEKCVKFLYMPGSHPIMGFDYLLSFKAEIIKDSDTPSSVELPNVVSFVWGIFHYDQSSETSTVYLRHIELIPSGKQPIQKEGLYTVGENGDISPGVWKSGLFSTDTDSCYWARINPSDGSIKDNHFGIGGVTITLYEGDVFETNEDCTPWFFVNP